MSSTHVSTILIRPDLIHPADHRPTGLVALRPSRWDRVVTRSRCSRLDRELAAGHAPEGDRHRALRAAQLVAPSYRDGLANDWAMMLGRARSPRLPGDPSAPLARGPIMAADREIRDLTAALRSAGPVAARGVAMARQLLTDGSGPLYRSRTHPSLIDALAETTGQLDPAIDVTSEQE